MSSTISTSAPTNVIGSGSDAIVLTMSEDADGPIGATGRDAEFTVSVDGQQIGGLQTVTASHAAGQTEAFTFAGNFAPGQHSIAVTFSNNSMTAGDKAAFDDGGDRNLYVNGVTYDGSSVSSKTTGIYESPFYPPLNTGGDPMYGDAVYTVTDATAVPSNAPSTPTTTPAPVSYGSGNDTLDLAMSEDPYNGDGQFTVAIDGKQVGGTFTTSAIEWEGQQQHFLLKGSWGNVAHSVTVAFLNDAIGAPNSAGGYDQNDRNVFVMGISYDGAVASGTPWGIFNNGSATFNVPASQPPTPPTVTPSANDTVVKAGSGDAIIDANGNRWTITGGGQVAVNGTTDTSTANVIELAYVNGAIWQENSSNRWWGTTSSPPAWSLGAGTSTSPLPSDTLMLRVSEDAYQGNAQFTVSVDGQSIGTTMTASALHSTGDSNVFILTGGWGQGVHDVKVQFLNDAYGGSASADRNLYVDSIAYDGGTYAGTSATFKTNGAKDFSVGGSIAAAGAPADTLTLHVAEDAWNGDAKFILSVDGKTIAAPQAVTASHAAGAWQDLTFSGNFGAGSHDVGISFTNDAYGGSASTDRNLYINGVDFDGTHSGSGVTSLHITSTAHFTV